MRIKLPMTKTALIMILAVFIGAFALTGCSDDDENKIDVCNQDDEEYVVKLYHENDQLADDFRLGEWYDFADLCDKFKNVATGWYYITIHENSAEAAASDTSEKFYMESNTTRNFWIKSPGELKTSEDGIIEVCNTDDEEYSVKLHSDSDDVVVDNFWLEEVYDITHTCDNFEGIPNGSYYITIHENGVETASDTSEVFVYDGAADKFFKIESPGRIERD